MSILALREEVILSALWMLGGRSHGAVLRKKVIELSNKEIVYGTLYNLLDNLMRKGLVSSQKGIPTPEKGGKSKMIYSITKEGRAALQETKNLHESIFNNLPDLQLGTSE